MERQLRHLNLDAAEFTFSGSLEKSSHLTPSWSQATTSNLDGWDFNTSTAFRNNQRAEERFQYSPPTQNQQWSDTGSHNSGGSGIWGDDHSRGSQTSGTIPSYNPTLTDFLSRSDAPLKPIGNQEYSLISDDFRSIGALPYGNLLREAQQEDNASSYFDSNAFSSADYFGSISSQSVGSIPGLVPSSSSITSTGSGWKSQTSSLLPKKQSSLAAAIAAASNSNAMAPPPGFHSENFAEDEPSERSVGSRDRYDSNNRRRGKNSKGPRTNVTNSRRQNPMRKSEGEAPSFLPASSMSDPGSMMTSQAIQQLLRPENKPSKVSGRPSTISEDYSESNYSLTGHYFDHNIQKQSILPQPVLEDVSSFFGGRNQYYGIEQAEDGEDDVEFIFGARSEDEEDTDSFDDGYLDQHGDDSSPRAKKREWLLRMNKKLAEVPVGELDPAVIPLTACMNSWAKTKSANGASMAEMWLKRAEEEKAAGNTAVVPTTKMYTMAVDAWARSGQGAVAAQNAEALLQRMYNEYQSSGKPEALRPTNAIFNAVINAWARSQEATAPHRAEQILNWMQQLGELDVQPDKYTFNTVIHAYAKVGGADAAVKAQDLLARMHRIYEEGNLLAKPDTISYNVVINSLAKSGGKGACNEAEKLLSKMHYLYERGDSDVKPNVVTYGAVIDSFAKSGEPDAATRADSLLATMIQLHQSDPVRHADLLPNTYVFNTVINSWAKNKDRDAASKAEEMLVAMSRLHASGMPSLKPDNFTYTAVIDAWSKSGCRGAAARADQLLDKMEAKYLAGDKSLKPNSYTYNAVICALAKSGEPGAAARAERVLQNMVNRHRAGGDDDVKPTTINFNTVLDAYAKSGGGRSAAERAEEILEWMDSLHKNGNPDVKVDTISFNAVLDAWARSGDQMAPRRAEQILDHMDDLYRSGNKGVKPDRYTYNTLINVWAKSGERGSAARAEHVLAVMEKRCRDGDQDFKPNTRTYTSVIDSWAKSGEKGAARRAEQILNNMISRYEAAGDPDVKPNVHTTNAVCNACAFSKHPDDREEALQIAFRVYNWLKMQPDMCPDSYTYTILLSVCANLLPRENSVARYNQASAFFESCRNAGYVNDYVLRKLRQTVSDDEFMMLVEYRTEASASSLPHSWTRNAKVEFHGRSRKASGNWSNRRKGK
ncbi:hypothetical protein FisN_18Lh140 [Fistulifera solaris]|uniref:Pentacotripeptide-repeat region of PRORP domain-containing protein n=1 Tax=Fistulifera solaris TaxID=1519565 RepID=A0A1Z5KFA9_FISSO|nr:hypothetical protein FisN_18Lh140 [Fistulifera solaris]|eukprot:GAX24782.1 hypothetical protein FisN_18Lh140 [Fistulifera solaris]